MGSTLKGESKPASEFCKFRIRGFILCSIPTVEVRANELEVCLSHQWKYITFVGNIFTKNTSVI